MPTKYSDKHPCSLCGTMGHLRKEHKKIGLCTGCTTPVTEPTKRGICGSCAQKKDDRRHAYDRERRGKDVQAGLCIACRRRPIDARSASRCDVCLQKMASMVRGEGYTSDVDDKPEVESPVAPTIAPEPAPVRDEIPSW